MTWCVWWGVVAGPGGARSADAVVGALRAMKDNFRAG